MGGSLLLSVPKRLITRRCHFVFTRFNSWNPTPVGCDRLSEANTSITQAARDRETAESLGQNGASEGRACEYVGSRATSGERLRPRRECRKPLRIQRISRPVSPPAQNKTPGSRCFATPGFKLREPNSVRTVANRSVMTRGSLPEWWRCEMRCGLSRRAIFTGLGTTPASQDPAPDRNRTTTPMRSNIAALHSASQNVS